MKDAELQAMLDERSIYKILVRHCIADDRKDAETVRDCYWPEAVVDHGVMPAGNAHAFIDMSEGSGAKKMLLRDLHSLCHVAYDIDGTRARVESYVISYHRVVNEPGAVEMMFGASYRQQHRDVDTDSHNFLVGGRYLDLFEKRRGEWRILNRSATAEWEFTEPASTVLTEGLFKAALGADTAFAA